MILSLNLLTTKTFAFFSKFLYLKFLIGAFLVQWVILSFVIGLPLMTFHSSIGQAIGGSVIDMWVISPIFQVKFFLLNLFFHLTNNECKNEHLVFIIFS